ncbi:pentapeptide repeat-containing protein, partial [bacterium]|nr:pentapeptide repeat-containing protein [bacterium]
MSEEGKKEEDKKERRFSQEQYDMLKRCSEKKDMTEWNEWRKQNPDETIFLDKMNFIGWYLSGSFLNTGAVVVNPGTSLHEQWVFRGQVYLRGSVFLQAKLHDTDFRGTHLEEAMFNFAELEGACLELACLQRARLLGANLKGVDFSGAELQGADFSRAIVDGETLIWGCKVDRMTDFRGVGLDGVRIDPGKKQLLEYNIRRMNW